MQQTPPPAPRLNLASLLRKPAEIVVADPVSAEPPAPVSDSDNDRDRAPTPVSVPRIRPVVLPSATPPPGPVAAPDHAAAPAGPAAAAEAPLTDQLAGLHWPGAQPPAQPLADTATAPATAPAAAPLPGFLRAQHRRRAPAWQWAVLLVLALALLLQVLLADRDRLAANPSLRPLLTTLCQPLGCDLPPWREPAAITMIERDVQPLPGRSGVLVVQASFRNDARWEQALPDIELTLASADGQVAGRRRFTPADYHPGHTRARLAPGQTLSVQWQVAEPALTADTFHFRFR